MEDIFIVTNSAYTELVKEQLTGIPEENILAEPCARNTAPCIAFAAAVIEKKYGDAVMLVLPSDHLISYEALYAGTLRKAISVGLQDKNLVTIGITPTYPETGYGYINFSSETAENMPDAYKVARFVEKPDLPTAKEYLSSGRYLWNSGMFVWKASSILSNIKEFLPGVYEGAEKIGNAYGTSEYDDILEKEYSGFVSESIDFGVMEKADDIYTIPGSFGWDDVGSWLAVERINEVDNDKNYIEGDVISVGSERTTICGGKRLIAAVGIEDVIIVDTDDAVLVCSKNNTQDVKKVIALLKEQGRNNLV
jgi:mannose-1-phosphate guanylyltransferase